MDKLSILKSLPLFQHLREDEISQIAEIVKYREFKKGEVIIEQEDSSNSAFIILSGGVRVYRISGEGEEVNLAVLGQGEIIGEMSLLDDETRSAFVETIQQTEVLELEKLAFVDLLKKNPEIAINLLKALTHRVRTINQRLEDIVSKNLLDRSWAVLEALSEYFPDKQITLSQEELSQIIGATRARVTEVLQILQKQGKISVSHKKIHIN